MMNELHKFVEMAASYSAEDLNNALGLPLHYDQSKGNRCDRLTADTMQALQNRGLPVRREFHQDEAGNWHYLLAHTIAEATPHEQDLISDLNPWQWRSYGGGILHAPRQEVMEILRQRGAPEHFIALRGLETIVMQHDTQANPFSHLKAS